MTVTSSTPAARPERSSAREQRLLAACGRGDERAQAELVAEMLPFVRRIARAYADRGEPLEDLVQVGCIGLLLAIKRFDPSRGVRFAAFAAPTISGEIRRHFRDRGWAMRVPRDLQELYARIGRVRVEFERTNGRSPTVDELCTATGRSEDDVLDAIAAGRNYRMVSIDSPSPDSDEPMVNGLGSRDSGYPRAEARAMIGQLARRLPQRDRNVLALYFVADLTQRDVARRLGMSQMHVSRILRQATGYLQSAAR